MTRGLRSTFVALVWLLVIVMTAADAAKLRRTIGDGSGHRHGGGNGLTVHHHRSTAGLCATMGQCCQGKDNHCRAVTSSGHRNGKLEDVQGNSTSARGEDGGCFCDAACLELGDCCADYKEACKRE